MPKKTNIEFSRAEISHLAFINWEKDGCPHGRELDYWLEAEKHLAATWHLHVKEQGLHRPGTVKARTGVTLRLHARPSQAQVA